MVNHNTTISANNLRLERDFNLFDWAPCNLSGLLEHQTET